MGRIESAEGITPIDRYFWTNLRILLQVMDLNHKKIGHHEVLLITRWVKACHAPVEDRAINTGSHLWDASFVKFKPWLRSSEVKRYERFQYYRDTANALFPYQVVRKILHTQYAKLQYCITRRKKPQNIANSLCFFFQTPPKKTHTIT